MFGPTSGAQKGSDLDVGYMAARGAARLGPHEHIPRGISDRIPTVTVRATTELSHPLHAAGSCSTGKILWSSLPVFYRTLKQRQTRISEHVTEVFQVPGELHRLEHLLRMCSR